jgi:hypothetical protein
VDDEAASPSAGDYPPTTERPGAIGIAVGTMPAGMIER